MATRIAMVFPCLVIICQAAATGAQQGGNPAAGLDYAARMCATCHALRKGDQVSPNPLAPAFEVIANGSGVTALSLSTHLRSVHENMPNFILPPHEQDDVIAYILSLEHER